MCFANGLVMTGNRFYKAHGAIHHRGIIRAAKALTLSLVAEIDGCVVGHPDYYRKFGFENMPGLVLEGVPPEFFFSLSFDDHTPQGTVIFHEGFKADGPKVIPADG